MLTEMLRKLSLVRFRALEQFSMSGLGRINLLVGTNNCGKTSILEAIQVLTARGEPWSIWSALYRRGERTEMIRPTRPEVEVDLCHLFYGHEIAAGSAFSIAGENDGSRESITATVVERADAKNEVSEGPEVRQDSLPFEDSEAAMPGRLALSMKWGEGPEQLLLPISRRGGLRSGALERRAGRDDDAKPIRFITTASLERDDIVSLFETIVLTPEEDVLIEALRTIEPALERIAPLGTDRRRGSFILGDRGGIVVKCKGMSQRIPIGSMGDGIWRMLGIALSVVRTPNGLLLVDEIDTGLHYSVMASMWQLVLKAAERLNVQVFATTHSRDCYESLAAISRDNVEGGNQVSIQRIERGRSEAISFTEPEILIAAQRGIEAR
jgi:hypothetical protein